MAKILVEIDVPDTWPIDGYIHAVMPDVEYQVLVFAKSINEWCKFIHKYSNKKGFYKAYDDLLSSVSPENHADVIAMFIAQRLALIHSEVTEILEAVRDGDEAHELEELADTVIRCFDYAAFRGFSLEGAIIAKMDVNEKRPFMHGKTTF